MQRIERILIDRRDMLAEYFALTISEDGHLQSIPLLLRDYVPNLDNLPSFLMRLGPQVCSLTAFICSAQLLNEYIKFRWTGLRKLTVLRPSSGSSHISTRRRPPY